jgi:SAM-dependent methyltransferase
MVTSLDPALDLLLDGHLTLLRALERGAADPAALHQRVSCAVHDLALGLLPLVADYGLDQVTAELHGHPLHGEVLLRSDLLRLALDKPRGYAGDADLTLMVCERRAREGSALARSLSRVLLDLPALAAVRRRVDLLEEVLAELPAGARVLVVGCGPAVELRRHRAAGRRELRVDLLDHDPAALDQVARTHAAATDRLLRGNVYRLIDGDHSVRPATGPGPDGPGPITLRPGYDLVYSAALYDYIPTGDEVIPGAPTLTARLYRLLRPGGRLLVANALTPARRNPHRPHHRLMLELFAEWFLVHRTPDEMAQLAAQLPAGECRWHLHDEYHRPLDAASTGASGLLSVLRHA